MTSPKEKALLCLSSFKLKDAMADALGALLADMIEHNKAIEAVGFTTPGGRPALIALAFGKEAEKTLMSGIIDAYPKHMTEALNSAEFEPGMEEDEDEEDKEP